MQIKNLYADKEAVNGSGIRCQKIDGVCVLVVFGNDDTIEEKELEMLKKIAFEDGVIDEDERRVLRKIFSRVTKDQVADAVWSKIEQFRHENGI